MAVCECCEEKYEQNNILESEWRQYCKHCFVNKGNHKHDIIKAGENSKGYPYYKIVKKKPMFVFVGS